MRNSDIVNVETSGEVSHAGGQSLKDRVKVYVKGNWKLCVVIAVIVATATALITHYSQSRSNPQATTSKLSSPATNRLQGEKELIDYDLGVREDSQFRDCSSKVHWKTTFPDFDHSLFGYDILYGDPMADGRDPGFRYPIFKADFSKPKQSSDCRYVIPKGFIVVPSESCMVSFESKLIRNKKQMSAHLEAQAEIKGGGWGFEFSASARFQKDQTAMSTGEFLFVLSRAECENYYSMVDFTNPPPFDPGFVSWAKTLAEPSVSNETVMKFIDYYGTHFFTGVTFGAKFIQHHKMSQKTYESLKKSKISVEAQASYSGLFSIGGGFSLDKEQSEAASNFAKSVETITYTMGSTPPSNGDAMTWAASSKQNPVPMLYSLSPIDLLFTDPFIQELTPGKYNAIREKLSNISKIYCQALRNKGRVHSCEPHFQIQSEGVEFEEKGYIYIENADISACLVFCRQDEKCTSFVYSELAPPFKGSYCSFYNNTFALTLKVPEKNNSTGQSYLIIVASGEKDLNKNIYSKASLNGNCFLTGWASKAVSCGTACLRNPFCDAVNVIRDYVGYNCFFYSRQDITSITYDALLFAQLFM